MQRSQILQMLRVWFLSTFLLFGLLLASSPEHVLAQTNGTPAPALSGSQTVPEPQTFGSWIKFCTLPTGTPTVLCELLQSARAKDRPDISFRVSFFKNQQPEKFTLLRVIVPIHVELRLGVGIMIDGSQDMGNMPYSRCGGEECVAEVMLSDEDLEAFFNGKTATFYIFTTPEQGIGGIIDLDGVREGYAALP